MHEDELRSDSVELEPQGLILPPPDRIAIPMAAWGCLLPTPQMPSAIEPEEDEDPEAVLERLQDEALDYLSMN